MSANNGKPCKKCGANEWDRHGKCAPCVRKRARKWYAENQDRALENVRKYRVENLDKIKGTKRNYRAANQGKIRETNQSYRVTNQDKVRELRRKWFAENQDKAKESRRKWRANNPDKEAATRDRHRTRKTAAGGSYTAEEWKALCEQYDNRCLKCGRDDVKLTPDHVIPVAKGGSSDISNIQPLCGACNSSKGGRHQDYRTKPSIGRWIQKKLFG